MRQRDRRNAAALVIDGEAILVDRVAVVKTAVARAAARPAFPSFETQAGSAPERRRPAFGTRAFDPIAATRRHHADLLFQGGAARPSLPAPGLAGGMSLFLQDTAGSIPNGRKMAALGIFVLSLLVPAAVVIAHNPNAAPGLPGAAAHASQGLVIENVDARISARESGDILEVEGVLRNTTTVASMLPPLRIALASDEGTTTLRPVSTGHHVLAAGAELRFRSAVAVPGGTQGDVSVVFASDVGPLQPVGLGYTEGEAPAADIGRTSQP